jgi:hypothetical protein
MSPRREDEPRVEGDAIAGRAFWGSMASAAAAVVAAVLVSFALLRAWAPDRPRAPRLVMPAELGVVEQTLILDTRRGLDDKARQRESLRHYGWMDSEHRVAKLPIERAMDLVVDPDFMQRAFAADGGR